MRTNVKSESEWSEQQPNQVPMYPKRNGRLILSDDEVRAAIDQGRALRAAYTKAAAKAVFRFLAGIPETVESWFRSSATTAHKPR